MEQERIRRRPRAETRAALLDAAARVIARRGFHGASVEAVSGEAGFSTGALYSNFKSKEDLFLALYEERIQRRRREIRNAVGRAGGEAAGLAAATDDVAESLRWEREWFLLYFEFALHAARDPAFARRFESVREDGLAELAGGLGEALGHAGIDAQLPLDQLAQAIRALTYGLALDRILNEKSVPDALPGRVIGFVFRGLRAEGGSDGAG